MSTYKGINGFATQNIAGDPTFNEGQVWYNSATASFKANLNVATGAWATGGNLNNNSMRLGSAGTQTAGLAFAGQEPGPINHTETYNGTSWSDPGANYPASIEDLTGSGSQTSALGYGGASSTTSSNSWNGSSWTGAPSMNVGHEQFAGCGPSNTAALAFGGNSGGYQSACESYNGSWANSNVMNTARYGLGGAGSSTLAIAAGGGYEVGTGPTAKGMQTELYNGSWTTVANLVTPMLSWSIAGTTTSCVGMSGYTMDVNPGILTTQTQSWNGSAWTISPATNSVARKYTAGCGTSAAALLIGGETPGATNATEEFSAPGSATVTITTE
tara:strand:- start:14 stop:1000 length:987 start_codon:yes stop_codon:yes gene_type:complete